MTSLHMAAVSSVGIYERVAFVEMKRFSYPMIVKLFFTFPEQENHHDVVLRNRPACTPNHDFAPQ
jgi:hypothetical protein